VAKILIVDDNPGNRSLLVEILGRSGHTIREASDGGEALALVSAERPDLVIADILMPAMDGYEFGRRLRSTPEIAHTPVIFWTAVFRERDAKDLARECGVEYVLPKPCSDETVLQTVEACLQKVALPMPVAQNFDRDHLRLVMDKLTKQATEMAAVNSQLDALLEASLRLSSETDPSRLLDEFCKSARHLINAKFGMVGIIGENGEQAYIAGLSSEAYPGLKDITRVNAVMAGLLSGQQPVRARNTSADPTKFGFPKEFPAFSSLLAAPIVSPTYNYGWLCLFHRIGAVEFTEEDARLTGILGGLAGRIYEKCRLYADIRSQKLEALRRLAGGMAHDFNNALNVVIGYSKLLLANSDPRQDTYRRVEEIHKAGERAAALTSQLLAFSGKQMLQPRAVNAADLLRELEPTLRAAVGQDVEILMRIGPGVHSVWIDPVQIQQAILNLIANAREALPSGGTVTIDLTNTELDEVSARAYEIAAGRYATIVVADNGRGISSQLKPRVFDPFFTTKPPGQGMGLGLATVYGIIKQSGGHVLLESAPGVGTTATVFLPQHVDRTKTQLVKGKHGASSRHWTILVVEDDSAIRLLVEEILSSAGYTVLVAGSGARAIQLADEYEGSIHLLLTDVVLPTMGGKEIASRVALVRPDIKILFMSGYTGNVADERDNLEPGVEFLQKPFTPDILCEKINGLLSAPPTIRRILVVDDDASLRNLLAQTLEGAGFQAFTAEDGRDARAQVEEHQIDLVITDLAMPREEGMELIRALRKRQPDLKIVAMSGAFGSDVLRAAQALGAHISLVKPVSKEMILKSIDQLSQKC
jgi:two-component system, cell cycle sensor histidine kinase and response regulator CckA